MTAAPAAAVELALPLTLGVKLELELVLAIAADAGAEGVVDDIPAFPSDCCASAIFGPVISSRRTSVEGDSGNARD